MEGGSFSMEVRGFEFHRRRCVVFLRNELHLHCLVLVEHSSIPGPATYFQEGQVIVTGESMCTLCRLTA